MAQLSALHEDPELDIAYLDDNEVNEAIDRFSSNVDHVKRLSLWDELAQIDPSQLFQSQAADYYFETEANDYIDYDDEYDDDMTNEEEEEKEMKVRKEWKAEDLCLIYSRSKDKWFDGKISEIRTTEEKIEWLVVKFGEFGKKKKTKKIQRFCKDIKPIPIDHASYIVVGSHDQIFSYISPKWCDGEVIEIFYDEQGIYTP